MLNKTERINALWQQWHNCMQCHLCSYRQRLVFGYGNPDADIMIVGEAPGANEDQEGLPFVGKSGNLLDRLLTMASVQPDLMAMTKEIERSGEFDHQKARDILLNEFFYTNVVCCRPPENRTPTPKEVKACEPRLKELIYLVDPIIILAMGGTAAEALVGKKVSITNARGQIFDVELEGREVSYRVPVMALLHPSYLLRVSDFSSEDGLSAQTFYDICYAMQIVDEYRWRHHGVAKPTERPKPRAKK